MVAAQAGHVPVKRPLAAGLGVAALVLAIDQISKHWILGHFEALPDAPPFTRILPVLNLVLSANRGITFGLFNNDGRLNAVLFSILALAIVTGLVLWLRRAESLPATLAIGLVIGGAIGNLADRLRLGSVVDFLDFHWGPWHFYTFNLADSAISVGVGLLVLDSLLDRSKSPK